MHQSTTFEDLFVHSSAEVRFLWLMLEVNSDNYSSSCTYSNPHTALPPNPQLASRISRSHQPATHLTTTPLKHTVSVQSQRQRGLPHPRPTWAQIQYDIYSISFPRNHQPPSPNTHLQRLDQPTKKRTQHPIHNEITMPPRKSTSSVTPAETDEPSQSSPQAQSTTDKPITATEQQIKARAELGVSVDVSRLHTLASGFEAEEDENEDKFLVEDRRLTEISLRCIGLPPPSLTDNSTCEIGAPSQHDDSKGCRPGYSKGSYSFHILPLVTVRTLQHFICYIPFLRPTRSYILDRL
jgi:hypothetical protein